jgi:hypothetical protein
MQIPLKIIAVFFILVSAITISGCRGTTPLPSIGSGKHKYAYLYISTTPSNALVYMKSHATIDIKKGISILPMNIEQPDNENPEWELIGTTPINKHKVLYESHGRLISLFACASLYMDISIDLKIEKDGYKTIFLNNVSFNSDKYTQLDIDLVQTENW